MPYNNYSSSFHPYYGTNDPNAPFRFNYGSGSFSAPPVPTLPTAPTVQQNQTPQGAQSQRGLFGGFSRGGGADRREGAGPVSFRDVPTGTGQGISYPGDYGSFSIKDAFGSLGGLLGTGGGAFGQLASAAISPSGFTDTRPVNIPGIGNVATSLGAASPLLAAVPGASLVSNIFGQGALANIDRILREGGGVVGDFGGGNFGSYEPGAFGLNGNFAQGALGRAQQAALANAYYDRQRAQAAGRDPASRQNQARAQATQSLSQAGVSLGGRNIRAGLTPYERRQAAGRGGSDRESRAREADRASASRDRTAERRNS